MFGVYSISSENYSGKLSRRESLLRRNKVQIDLTGLKSYPEPDSTVNGGLIATYAY